MTELVTDNAGQDAKQLAPFDEFKAQVERLKSTAQTLIVSDVNDRAGMKLARATRLSLREVRIAIEHRRKELGEHHLRETQRINSDAKALRDLIEPLELRLENQENFAEREATRIAEEKRTARTAAEAERARIEAQRVENERLKKEAAEREEAAKKEREEAAAKLKAEQERAAKEKARAEADAKAEREALQRKADAEAKRIREEAAERERVASEKAKAEADIDGSVRIWKIQ